MKLNNAIEKAVYGEILGPKIGITYMAHGVQYNAGEYPVSLANAVAQQLGETHDRIFHEGSRPTNCDFKILTPLPAA